MGVTITFDEKNNGWTSFHSWEPDAMARLKNRLYSVKDGQLWVHEDPSTDKNKFYGVQYDTWVETIINDASNDVKVFKTINTESSSAWKAELTTNLAAGTIESSEFLNMEGEFFAHARQSETSTDYSSDSAIRGIGGLTSINTGTKVLTFNQVPPGIAIGDGVYVYDGVSDNADFIGTCTAYDGTTVTVDNITTIPAVTQFIIAVKNHRIESSAIRGYYLMVRLTSVSSADTKIFAVNSEVMRSFD